MVIFHIFILLINYMKSLFQFYFFIYIKHSRNM